MRSERDPQRNLLREWHLGSMHTIRERELGGCQADVLDEGHLVDVLALVAAHQEVPVQIIQIRLEGLRDEGIIKAGVVIFDLNVVLRFGILRLREARPLHLLHA